MKSGSPAEEERLFEAARQLATPGQRAAFLDAACGGDLHLRQRVETLLRAQDQAAQFLENPPVTLSAETLVVAAGVATVTEKPGESIDRYKLLQQIGEGACGVVYMAEQQEPVRRRVALKIIKLGMDTKQVIARFGAERQALALMDHPNIAKVLDAGASETGRPYFVMELVKGVRITDYCDQNHLSTAERLELFIQVCHAIQHAHQKGIIHRDLKPSNIMVTLHDGVPVPKVIDFGIAKATTGQRLTDETLFTAIEQFMGTPAYMSPEQAELSGLDIDTRADIYALGVLLYELLTGKTPFEVKRLMEAALHEIRRIIREEDPPRPSTRISTLAAAEQTAVAKSRQAEPPKLLGLIRGDLDWIVMKTLEKDRARRYETANGLAIDIQRFLDNEPIVARPPSKLYRLSKMVRRNKLAFAAGSAVAASLVSGLGFSTSLFLREKQARDRAVAAEKTQAGLREQAEDARKQEATQRLAAQSAEKTAKAEAKRAEAATTDARMTLATSDFLQAVRLIEEDKDRAALAYLARSLIANPTNEAAVTRLATLLTFRSWVTPTLTLQHSNEISSGQFSWDGKRILTASIDGTARVWDAHTGKLLAEMEHHPEVIYLASFSGDGKRIVTASTSAARVWDAQTGQPLAGPLKHTQRINSTQFSPDGKAIVTASSDGTARVWDAETGQPLTEPLKHTHWVSFAQFSPDGSRIVTASWDKTARTWDAQTGQPLSGPLRHAESLDSARFSPDGKRIVTTSRDNTARVWDTQTGEPLAQPLKHGHSVVSTEFSPDGNRIVTASLDATARIWDAQTGQPLTEPLRHGDNVVSAEFSPDGNRIVTASHDGTARLWDTQTGQPLTEPLKHRSLVWSAHFSPDGTRVVTASYDGTACVWDVHNRGAFTEPLSYTGSFRSARFSPDAGRRIVTASTNVARVWDARTGQPLLDALQHQHEVLSASFSPDGKRIVTASTSGAHVWDALTGQLLLDPLQHDHQVVSASLSLDGRRIVTISNDGVATEGSARVWDAQTGQPLTAPLQPEMHEIGIRSAQFSPDGNRIVTVSQDGSALIWDAQTGQRLAKPLRHGFVSSAVFSPDGKRLVAGSAGKTAQVLDAESGEPLMQPLKHDAQVVSAQFSPDGKRIVTASMDKTARVWDAQTGQPLTEPLKHTDGVSLAQFSPDGKRVLTVQGPWGSKDGTVRVWDVAPSPASYPEWLLPLAQSLSGLVLNRLGVLKGTNCPEVLDRIRQELGSKPEDRDWVTWGRWFFAHPSTRTISPFSKITISKYVANRINENTPGSLQEAEMLATGNMDLVWRIREARVKADEREQLQDLHEQGVAPAGPAKLAEAEALYRDRLAISRARVSPDEGELADLLARLTAILLAEAKFAQAEQPARECMAMREKTTPDDWLTFESRSLLGGSLLGQKKYAEAEPLLLSGYQGMKQREGHIPARGLVRLKDAFERLSGLYTVTGRPEQAARVKYRAVEEQYRRAADLGDAMDLNNLAWLLATCPVSELRDGPGAVALAEKAVTMRKRKDPMILDTLAAAYAETGQFAKAISAQEEAIGALHYGEDDFKKDYLARLKLYESNTPYRDPDGVGSGIQ